MLKELRLTFRQEANRPRTNFFLSLILKNIWTTKYTEDLFFEEFKIPRKKESRVYIIFLGNWKLPGVVKYAGLFDNTKRNSIGFYGPTHTGCGKPYAVQIVFSETPGVPFFRSVLCRICLHIRHNTGNNLIGENLFFEFFYRRIVFFLKTRSCGKKIWKKCGTPCVHCFHFKSSKELSFSGSIFFKLFSASAWLFSELF